MEFDIERILEGTLKIAEGLLQKDDMLAPVAFAVSDEGMALIPLRTVPDKYEAHELAAKFARKIKAKYLVTVNDAALRLMPAREDRNFFDGMFDPTESPLSYPEGHPSRKECIVIQMVEFPTFKPTFKIVTYTKNNGVYGFEPYDIGDAGEQMGGAIMDCIKKGWSEMDVSIKLGLAVEGTGDLQNGGGINPEGFGG